MIFSSDIIQLCKLICRTFSNNYSIPLDLSIENDASAIFVYLVLDFWNRILPYCHFEDFHTCRFAEYEHCNFVLKFGIYSTSFLAFINVPIKLSFKPGLHVDFILKVFRSYKYPEITWVSVIF